MYMYMYVYVYMYVCMWVYVYVYMSYSTVAYDDSVAVTDAAAANVTSGNSNR